MQKIGAARVAGGDALGMTLVGVNLAVAVGLADSQPETMMSRAMPALMMMVVAGVVDDLKLGCEERMERMKKHDYECGDIYICWTRVERQSCKIWSHKTLSFSAKWD